MLDLSLFARLAAKVGCEAVTPVAPQNDHAARVAEMVDRTHRGAAAYAGWLALGDEEGYGEAEQA